MFFRKPKDQSLSNLPSKDAIEAAAQRFSETGDLRAAAQAFDVDLGILEAHVSDQRAERDEIYASKCPDPASRQIEFSKKSH